MDIQNKEDGNINKEQEEMGKIIDKPQKNKESSEVESNDTGSKTQEVTFTEKDLSTEEEIRELEALVGDDNTLPDDQNSDHLQSNEDHEQLPCNDKSLENICETEKTNDDTSKITSVTAEDQNGELCDNRIDEVDAGSSTLPNVDGSVEKSADKVVNIDVTDQNKKLQITEENKALESYVNIHLEKTHDNAELDKDTSNMQNTEKNDNPLEVDGGESEKSSDYIEPEKDVNNHVQENSIDQIDLSHEMDVDDDGKVDETSIIEKQMDEEESNKPDEIQKMEFIQLHDKTQNIQNDNQPANDPFEGDSQSAQTSEIEPMEIDAQANKDDDTPSDHQENSSKENSHNVTENNVLDTVVEKILDSERKENSKIEKDSVKLLESKTMDNSSVTETQKQINEKRGSDVIELPSYENAEDKDDSHGNKKSASDSSKKISTIKVVNLASNHTIESSAELIDLEDETEEISIKDKCKQCEKEKPCKINTKLGKEIFKVCSVECKKAFDKENKKALDIPSEGVSTEREKRCAFCLLIVETNDERSLSWETMEFCNDDCLSKFQNKYGSYCRNCNGQVQPVSMGKYCVRFGYDVRQFCCASCLEEFKKGLKVCSYCQKDISAGTEGFLAPVGDKGQFKDFCTQDCMEKYSRMNSSEPVVPENKVCGVCQQEKPVFCEVQIDRDPIVSMCSEPCFAAFKFVNKVDPEHCSTCKKYFQQPSKKCFVVFHENEANVFCNKTCLNVFIISNRKIVICSWCKVKKYNFDMIKKDIKGQSVMMCSLNCLALYQVSVNAVSSRRIKCDFCKEYSQPQYHLTMSDATIRNFCTYNCVMNFQAQYTRSPITIPTNDDPVPTGAPKRSIPPITAPRIIQPAPTETLLQSKKTLPVISSVASLVTTNSSQNSTITVSQAPTHATIPQLVPGQTLQAIQPHQTTQQVQAGAPQIIYRQQVIIRPPSPPPIANKMTMCKPITHTKGVSVRPISVAKSTQTDEIQKALIPIPCPLHVPFPVHMYSMPIPIPVPIPIPIPVPIFIPTTRNSIKGIMKEIKKIQEKLPSDPFEAELLQLAEMAETATEKKEHVDSGSSDLEDDDSNREKEISHDHNNVHSAPNPYSPEQAVSSNTVDDMLQMALNMEDMGNAAVDLEAELTSSTIQAPQPPPPLLENNISVEQNSSGRGRKRGSSNRMRGNFSKRGRRSTIQNDTPLVHIPENQENAPPRILEPVEKPDANMALKYTFGINAWRQWVIAKNAEIEKLPNDTRKIKFKTDLLQMTTEEINYSLCLFVKEVRKPNGSEYAPDTIYYLCLGIQQFLYQHNRIDNIFTDPYYEPFTEQLNDIAVKFSTIYNETPFIVTRVEEEHLWECNQLGAHSPHVLLNTLMFFNTKHFNLGTLEEHMQLSFSHIMKHWKRTAGSSPSTLKPTGTKNIILRFYPPQNMIDGNAKKKRVYEQQENEENPVRCPVKLYEFYLSKCPESVKTRNDVFYLLPERSCVPESPVWYSTTPLAKDQLIKMIQRIKMVKEINLALLSS